MEVVLGFNILFTMGVISSKAPKKEGKVGGGRKKKKNTVYYYLADPKDRVISF